jgi:hypothetical protein
MFFSTLVLPGAQARRAKVRSIGYGLPSDFERGTLFESFRRRL